MTSTREHSVSPFNREEQVRVEFGNPPVAETAVGFYFQKIAGWGPLHPGALWERFRAKYPEYESLPPILDSPPQPSVALDLSAIPVRVAFVDKTKSQLVQTQNGLLLHNWRKRPDVPEYQHYEVMRAQLHDDWDTLKGAFREMALGEPVVTRCQMDYFNHLVRGEEWQDFSDLPNIFTVWRGPRPLVAVGKPEMVSFSVLYRLGNGNVTMIVQPAIRATDGKEMIQFTLSSSVVPRNSEDEHLFADLDECHANAFVAFLEFTTDQVRERWKQKK